MKTLAAYPYLTIYLHEEGACPTLELSWLGYTASTEFREAALQALALGAVHQVRAWLSDDRRLGALRPRDLDWVAEAGMQRLARMGIERFAQLESEDALNRRTIDTMYQQIMPVVSYEVRRFTDLAQARAWASGTSR